MYINQEKKHASNNFSSILFLSSVDNEVFWKLKLKLNWINYYWDQINNAKLINLFWYHRISTPLIRYYYRN